MDDIKVNFKDVGWVDVDWKPLNHERQVLWAPTKLQAS
jgi:hypothetical protein